LGISSSFSIGAISFSAGGGGGSFADADGNATLGVSSLFFLSSHPVASESPVIDRQSSAARPIEKPFVMGGYASTQGPPSDLDFLEIAVRLHDSEHIALPRSCG
jgi:hypothetical protein